MGYKMKPKKAILTRMKVTATGKLKHRHTHNSHLMSSRSGDMKRRNGRPACLYEGQARRLRRLAGVEGIRPCKIAHDRALADAQGQAKGQDAA